MGRGPWPRPSVGEDHEPSEGFGRKASQIVALDKVLLTDRVGKLSRAKIELLLVWIDVTLGR